jgi:membrane protein involved in colicin uptake
LGREATLKDPFTPVEDQKRYEIWGKRQEQDFRDRERRKALADARRRAAEEEAKLKAEEEARHQQAEAERIRKMWRAVQDQRDAELKLRAERIAKHEQRELLRTGAEWHHDTLKLKSGRKRNLNSDPKR